MLIRGNDLVARLKKLAPPFDAETERELIAIAYCDWDEGARAAAKKLVDQHVGDAKLLKSVLGAGFHRRGEREQCTRLRSLKIAARGRLASAMWARGHGQCYGVAFEEDPEFARSVLPALAKKRKGTLDLTEHWPNANTAWSLSLSTIPDVVFDELPKLRKAAPFDTLQLWAAQLELPPRFVELAPYLKRMVMYGVGFEELPDIVTQLTNLEELELREDKLVRMPRSLPRLKKLRVLRLLTTGAKLKRLPPEVCELPALEELDLSWTQIRELPPELGAMPKLKRVRIFKAKLSVDAVKRVAPHVSVTTSFK